MSKSILPMFSFSFMVSGLIFKYFYLFWVYFCIWHEKVVQFDSFGCSCPVFPTPFIEELSLPYSLCYRLIIHTSVGFFLSSVFCSIDLCVCSSPSTMLFWLLYLYGKSWSQVMSVFWVCSSPTILCWLFFLDFWLGLQWTYRLN